MAGIIKTYALLILGVVIMFLTINYQNKINVYADIYEAVKTTQEKTIYDSLNLGDLRVNNNLSIDPEYALKQWQINFEKNCDYTLNYQIEVVDFHESPPAIAIKVKAFNDLNFQAEALEMQYSSIIIIDKIE